MALSAAAQSALEWMQRVLASGSEVVRLNVPSDAIQRITYNPATGTLGLVFANAGTRYLYEDVPMDVVARLIAARSKGKFYHTHIKNQYGLGG